MSGSAHARQNCWVIAITFYWASVSPHLGRITRATPGHNWNGSKCLNFTLCFTDCVCYKVIVYGLRDCIWINKSKTCYPRVSSLFVLVYSPVVSQWYLIWLLIHINSTMYAYCHQLTAYTGSRTENFSSLWALSFFNQTAATSSFLMYRLQFWLIIISSHCFCCSKELKFSVNDIFLSIRMIELSCT